jgi:hypothetical protein
LKRFKRDDLGEFENVYDNYLEISLELKEEKSTGLKSLVIVALTKDIGFT